MKELIELSKKIGFESRIQLVHDNYKSPDGGQLDKLLNYLWMCELQKWLRDEHVFYISIRRTVDEKTKQSGWRFSIMLMNNFTYHDKYEQALQQGLIEAIKIIL